MAVVVVALDGGFLDGAVHAFDLAVRPGMLRLCKAVLDAVFLAAHVEHVRHSSAPSVHRTISRREGELDAVVGEHGVDLVGNGFDQGLQEGRRRGPRRSSLTNCTKANLLVRSMAT